MNKIIKTSCVSGLASEISRLKSKEKDLSIRYNALCEEINEVNFETVKLEEALELILETKEIE